MTAVIKNELGTITMNEELIASIAGFAAGENYGIDAMNSKTAGDALLQLVGGENVKRGVKVSILEDQSIDIDLYVTLCTAFRFLRLLPTPSATLNIAWKS